MKPAQINFVKECLPAAVSAGAAFNLNPLVILAQAAFESGWGTYSGAYPFTFRQLIRV